MEKIKVYTGAVLLFICVILIAAIDSLNFELSVFALIAAYFCGRDGGRLIIKYDKQDEID